MSTLERAIVIAAEAHADMVDKAGAPYVLHPLRIMLQLRTTDERIAAVLHDVVEDSMWTLEDLRREGFSDTVVDAIDHLTHRDGEPYEAYVERAAGHPVAARVKMEDLRDNMDLSRIAAPTERDLARIAKYERALTTLEARTSPPA